jgi:thymidylate synthase
MARIQKLTERDITNLVKRIVNEQDDMDNEGDLRSEIMSLIHNSNASHEEIVDILEDITDEIVSSKRIRRDVESRWSK